MRQLVLGSTDAAQRLTSDRGFVAFAVGQRSLIDAFILTPGGGSELYVAAGSPVVVPDGKRVTEVTFESARYDGGAYSKSSGTGNWFAGWALDGATPTRQDAPIENRLGCVPVHIIGYECMSELESVPRDRDRYPYLVRGKTTTWTGSDVERYVIPFAGRNRASFDMENTGAEPWTVTISRRVYDAGGSESAFVDYALSGATAFTIAAGAVESRVMLADDDGPADFLVVSGLTGGGTETMSFSCEVE